MARVVGGHVEVLYEVARQPRVVGGHVEVLYEVARQPRVVGCHVEVLYVPGPDPVAPGGVGDTGFLLLPRRRRRR